MEVTDNAYHRETVLYEGPRTGRVWQLQGARQQKEPVTLLRSPAGLFGTDLQVHRRSLPRSRKQRQVSVRQQPLTIELIVDVHAATPALTQRALSQFMQDWPDDGTPGKLSVHTRTGGWRHMDVYRVEKFHDMLGIAPQAANKAKLMIVASSDDPYPYGDYETVVVQVPGGTTTKTVTVTNTGDVPVAPLVYWKGLAGWVKFAGAAKFQTNVSTEALFDLDEEELTVTETRGTRPIVSTWDASPSCMVGPGESAALTVSAQQPGSFEVHMRPQFRELYG